MVITLSGAGDKTISLEHLSAEGRRGRFSKLVLIFYDKRNLTFKEISENIKIDIFFFKISH